jgi:hypothetical protein
MFPNPEERREMERWCATLIAKPGTRMEYGILLISEATGIGKTTLGSKILAPLVGLHNTGWPRETDIVESSFNEWLANKRLVICNEIYSGHSWKAYHTLKSIITDREITVNQKYQRAYTTDNWAHIFACSNSMQALKMEQDDRRWFYPEVTEERWGKEKFISFYQWLDSGGLGIIKTWAEHYGDYIYPGDRAPMTERKKEMIDGSKSEAQLEAVALAESLLAFAKPAALAMKDIIFAIRNSVQGKVFDTDYEIRRAMSEAGARVYPKRIRIAGRMQYVLCNESLMPKNRGESSTPEEQVVECLIKPNDLLENNM